MNGRAALIERIDAVLPQTQCRQCGQAGCRPYATAVADGDAGIDRCPPGGQAGVARIAAIIGVAPVPPDTSYGITKPLALAIVDEARCIGCTLCIQACPVDAIVGGAKRMHVVVAALCTGCELCIPPCPVDCIDMRPAGFDWDDEHAAAARERHDARAERLDRIAAEAASSSPRGRSSPAAAGSASDVRRQAIVEAAVEAAVERARVQRGRRSAIPDPPR